MESNSYSKMLKKSSNVSPNIKGNINKFSNQDKSINELSITQSKIQVTKYDMEETFDINSSHIIDKCFRSIKSDSELASNGILANEQYSSLFDFHKLIRNNVDLNHFYKKTMNS
jgi:hypothetical protein